TRKLCWLEPRTRRQLPRLNSSVDWQPNRKLAAAAATRAVGREISSVHLHQPFGEGQSDPQATLSALKRVVNLSEHVEGTLKLVRRNPNPRVTFLDENFVLLPMDEQTDASPGRRIFRCVGQKVSEHLC